MPNKQKDVEKFFVEIAVLKTQMKEVMMFQKYQMGALIAIGAAVAGAWVSR